MVLTSDCKKIQRRPIIQKNNCTVIFRKSGSDTNLGFSCSKNNRVYCDLDLLLFFVISVSPQYFVFSFCCCRAGRRELEMYLEEM